MKKLYKRSSLILILVILLAVSIYVWNDRAPSETAITIETTAFRQIVSSSGKIIPERSIEIHSQVFGLINDIPVQEGVKIHNADIIVELDKKNAENAYAQAELSLKVAENAFDEITKSGAARAAESLKQTKIALAKQEELLEDYEYLYENGALESQALENARAEYDTLNSQYNSAFANFQALQRGGTSYDAVLLQIEQASKRLESSILDLEKHTIKSPIDGVVTDILKEEGEFVQTGSPIMIIAENPASFVLMNVDESSIALLSLGQSAVIWPEGLPDLKTDATVSKISPKIDEDTGTIEVQLKLEVENDYFIQDMTVRAEIVVRILDEAIILPAKYLHTENPATVLVRDENETVARPISLEPVDLTNYLVLEGLEAGEVIVLKE